MKRVSLTASALLLAACSGPSRQAVSLLDYEAAAPAGWEARSPENSMRVAEFQVGDEPGAAEVIVYYFGPGQGGSAEANVTRWEGQFTGPDGGPVQAEVSTLEGVAFPTTLAELEGTYARGMGMGPGAGAAEPDQALMAAVVETPRGSLYPQLFGSREAVAAARDGFIDFVRSIAPREAGEAPEG